MAAPSSKWLSRDLSSLFYVLLVLALGIYAQRIDSSCKDLKGKNSEGMETSYGDVRDKIAAAVQEAGLIATTGKKALEDSANWAGSVFDNLKGVQTFNALQGNADGSPESTARWNKVLTSLEAIKTYVDDANNQPPVFICGDGYLTKFTNYEGGEPITDSTGAQSYQYFDAFTNAWLPVGEGGCEDAVGDIAITRMNQYIAICPGAFSFAQMVTPRATIGTDASVDWSAAQYNGNYEQSLEYWATPLSYTMFHELCHYLLNYEDLFLNSEVTWIGGTTNKAYKYNGATQLLTENPGEVDRNVDNLGMLALALFMSKSDWHTGRAVGDLE